MRIIDAIDIDWAGTSAWAAELMDLPSGALHLDIACGWGSFMAQICWRYPATSVVGLNIDLRGAHASIRELLQKAGVEARCSLVQSDARHLPFRNESFDSASCFLGLQDIQIGFGDVGVRDTIESAIRIVKRGGCLFFIDTEGIINIASRFLASDTKPHLQGTFEPAVQWNREIARKAIALYAHGYVDQMRIGEESRKHEEFEKVLARMNRDMEQQIHEKGYFNPLKCMHIICVEKHG
jgi:ubiquinone/menaquinone biosynthesis C-methylase UbiE